MDQEQKRLELVARIVIFFPLLVLLLGFLISSKQTSSVTLSEQVTPTVAVQESVEKKKTDVSSVTFDLNGPYQCIYTDASMNVEIAVKNKKVSATFTTDETKTNILVNGDCGYKWEEGQFTGEKMCNIGQYLSIIDMLSSMNLMSFDSVLSMIQSVDSSVSIDSGVMSSVAQTCQKQEVEDSVFTIPDIVFEDTVPNP